MSLCRPANRSPLSVVAAAANKLIDRKVKKAARLADGNTIGIKLGSGKISFKMF